MALLEVDNLRIEIETRRDRLVAVDGISFAIDAGEILGVVGESGAGKSLTGAAIIGLLDPPGRIARRIEHHRADGRRPRVPARPAVAIDHHFFELRAGRLFEQRVLRHGTRMAEQLSQYDTTLPAPRRICSASVEGIVR